MTAKRHLFVTYNQPMERLIEGAILGGLIGLGWTIWQSLSKKPSPTDAEEGHTTHDGH